MEYDCALEIDSIDEDFILIKAIDFNFNMNNRFYIQKGQIVFLRIAKFSKDGAADNLQLKKRLCHINHRKKLLSKKRRGH